MKKNHWLPAAALLLTFLVGCGAKEPDPGTEAPTPTPAIQIQEPQTQVLRSTDSRGYYTRTACYDLETMTVKKWDPKLPDGYRMTGEGPVSDGQALYFLLTRPGESSGEALARMPLEGGNGPSCCAAANGAASLCTNGPRRMGIPPGFMPGTRRPAAVSR